MPSERLQKIIAAAGVASRRKAEELITSGRVQVNGTVVTELGTKADGDVDHIRVDGKLLKGPEHHTYLVLNKPKGYVTTVSDPEKRPTVMDLVPTAKTRVYPVGRLDWASEGLLVLTNDGELANALMKASSNVPKTYVVKVAGQPDEGKLDKLRAGVSIAEKGGHRVRTAPARVRLIREADNPWLEVTIIEGRNRQVRKMFEEVGHHVEKIRRVQYGPLSLDVPPGEFRSLTLEEVSRLKAAAAGKPTFFPKPMVLPSEKPAELKSAPKVGTRASVGLRRPEGRTFSKPRRDFKGRPKFGKSPATVGLGESRGPEEFRPLTVRPQGLKPLNESPDRSAEALRHPNTDSRPKTGSQPKTGGHSKTDRYPKTDRRSQTDRRPPGRPYSNPSREFKPRRDFKPRGDFKPRLGVIASSEGRPETDFRLGREKPQGAKPSRGFGDRGGASSRPTARPYSKPSRDFKLRRDAKPRRDFRPTPAMNASGESRPKRDFRGPGERPQGLKPSKSFVDRSAEALRHPKPRAGFKLRGDAKPPRDFKPRRDAKGPRNFKSGRTFKGKFSPKS